MTARRLVGEAHPAGLAIWLGTPLLHYMYVAPGFSHACSAFAAALFIAIWLRVRETWSLGGLIGLGAVCALMVMVREQALFFVVGPAIDYLWSVAGAARAADWARVRTLVVRVAAGAAVSLLCYSPQMLIYLSLYGQLTTPYTLDDRMLWHAPHFFDVLFHPNHGFFFWTPLALVAVGGLAWFTWSGDGQGDARARRIGICLLAMVASQAYIAGAITRWELSGTFGQRRFIGTTIILVIGLAALFKLAQRPVWRRAVATLAVAGVIWNVGLMAQYGAQLMDRGRVELARNAYTTAFVLPRVLPTLAYRYLFDRSSFYLDPERYDEPSGTP